jgi:chloramphenicol O-acetyltransferase type A
MAWHGWFITCFSIPGLFMEARPVKIIDMLAWPRRQHYEFFKGFNHPHFNMCANVDLTKLRPIIKERQISLTIALIYLISRSANAVPEFRYRIRDGQVVEHETVSPSVTILVENDLFSFCLIEYTEDFSEFADRATKMIAWAKANPSLKDPIDRDDLLYMTVIPWVSFTSFTHPMRQHPADYIPRFAWGKTFEEGSALKLPLSVQGHHELMDGIHMGRLYMNLEEYLENPEIVLE